jgi:hypothetical protein
MGDAATQLGVTAPLRGARTRDRSRTTPTSDKRPHVALAASVPISTRASPGLSSNQAGGRKSSLRLTCDACVNPRHSI